MSEIANVESAHLRAPASTEIPRRGCREIVLGGRRERDIRHEGSGRFYPGNCPEAGPFPKYGAQVPLLTQGQAQSAPEAVWPKPRKQGDSNPSTGSGGPLCGLHLPPPFGGIGEPPGATTGVGEPGLPGRRLSQNEREEQKQEKRRERQPGRSPPSPVPGRRHTGHHQVEEVNRHLCADCGKIFRTTFGEKRARRASARKLGETMRRVMQEGAVTAGIHLGTASPRRTSGRQWPADQSSQWPADQSSQWARELLSQREKKPDRGATSQEPRQAGNVPAP